MRTHKLLAFLFIILGTFVFGQKNEEKLVRERFESYRTNLLNDNGNGAVEDVDSKTINYYSELLKLTKSADSSKIESLSIVDKMMVLILRLKVSKAEIVSFDGRSLFIYAVDNGMVGKGSVAKNTIGDINVNKNFAAAELLVNRKPSELYFEFYKEEGTWKLDITSLFPMANMLFEKLIADSEKSENDFLLPLIEAASGKKMSPEVWLPLE